MELLSEKGYMVFLILDGLFLLACTVWNLKIIYGCYQKGCPFQDGYHKVAATVVVGIACFLQALTPLGYRLIVLFFLVGLHLLFFVLLSRHNKANHTGERFLLLDHEIKSMEWRMVLGLVLLLIASFLMYREWKYWYGSNWLYAAIGLK